MNYKESALMLLSVLGTAYGLRKVKLSIMSHVQGGDVPVISVVSESGEETPIAIIISDVTVDQLKPTREVYSLDQADDYVDKLEEQYLAVLKTYTEKEKSDLSSKIPTIEELVEKFASKIPTNDKNKLN